MKRTRIKPRRAPRSWENRLARREYVAAHDTCEYSAINGCRNKPVDPEHFLGRNFHGADDPRCLLSLCRSCHTAAGRTKEAKVNGIWIKLRDIRKASALLSATAWIPFHEVFQESIADYRQFVESASGQLFTEIHNWIEAGSMSDAAVGRAHQILFWTGIVEE